ncbi:MAG: NUDIX domain-containing protein [Candidatus Omnitrophica bacterium]|nr:NUDIX domain-containing protein [Candidatus Omnitrophota bacterium]
MSQNEFEPLKTEDFKTLTRDGPLVAIDLIIVNREQGVLVGLRKNAPAKGCFFVPGGRIRKNETMAQAFNRIALTEVGQDWAIEQAKMLGAFDHIYINENFFEEDGLDTHYVTLGFMLRNVPTFHIDAVDQHEHYHWMPLRDLMQNDQVHANTKKYFQSF